jgi:uncharacterized protein
MRLFFDTSALLKKYISEIGSDNVDKLFMSAQEIFVSTIAQIESISALKRLVIEKEITETNYEDIKNEITQDFQFFNVIDLNNEIINSSIEMIDKYQLKSLDSIQLGTAIVLRKEISYFVACDQKLLKAVQKEGFKFINPNE